MWVPPEDKDPVLRHAPTRRSIACFGAGPCAPASSPTPSRRRSTPSSSRSSFACCSAAARRAAGSSSCSTTPDATTPSCSSPSSANAPAFSNCCSSRPAAPASRQSNGSGSWPVDSPPTTSTSRTSKHWSTRSPRVLWHGNSPTPLSVVYAALFKSLCLDRKPAAASKKLRCLRGERCGQGLRRLETALPVCLESALGGTGEASAFDSRRLACNAGFLRRNDET